MRCGVGVFFQAYDDWERYDAEDWERSPATSDAQIYDDEIALGSIAEPLGYDSIWTVEHHFTPYTMNPNPLQLLSFFAARTSRIDVGTMVVVLPWHDPIRVIEGVTQLDNLLQGRRLRFGVGRGTAKLEFEGLRIDMNSSRERFLEALDVVRKGLTEPRLEHKGKYYDIPPVHIRPRPRSNDITDNMYMAWGSPASVAIAAENGLRPLVVPQKQWHLHIEEMVQYNRIRGEAGFEPVSAVLMLGVYVHEDADVAQEVGYRHMDQWTDSSIRHYGFKKPEDFKGVKGYEYYDEVAAKASGEGALAYRTEHLKRQTTGNITDLADDLTHSHVWGTPDDVYEKVRDRIEGIGAEEVVVVFKVGNMTREVAEASMRLFAEKVLPRLQELPTPAPRTEATV